MITTVTQGNKLAFIGQKGPFYEVYYLKAASSDGAWSFWCRYTLLIPKDSFAPKEASLWGIFSAQNQKPIAIKKTFSLGELDILHTDSFIRLKDNFLSLDACQGAMADSQNTLSWDLQFEDPTLSANLYPHDFLYRCKFPKSKFVEPRWSTFISGTIKINHHKISLEHHEAHQAHIWGTQYATGWAWAHCNQFDAEGLVFEGLTAQIPLGGFLSPPMSLFHFYYNGEYFPANKMRQWFGANSKYDLNGWHFEIFCRDYRFVGTIRRNRESVVGVKYFGPNGENRFCHNSSRCQMELSVYRASKKLELIRKFESKSCAFETVDTKPHEGVNFLI
ncbi:MAG: hypothetical protein ACD_73C00671G0001 [uncultured bacterium]|nr:MAG: hypothetical protein ACD_73C00671G0001 [uncultured bacterium]